MAISSSDVHAVADRLAAAGQQPTLAAVRAALGGGSFTTISEAMKAWKLSQLAASIPVREATPVAVADRMGELATEVWTLAVGMANDRLAGEREALEQARLEMDRAQQEAAELADLLGADLDAAKAQIAQQADQLVVAQQQAALLSAAEQGQQIAQAALAEAQKRADGLQGLLEQERATAKAAQEKAEVAIKEAAHLAGQLQAINGAKAQKK